MTTNVSTSPETTNISTSYDQGILRIELNNPSALNALSTPMGTEITAAIREYAYRDDAIALVITGKGRSFCAGHDFNYPWQEQSPRGQILEFRAFREMFEEIEKAPVVTVAAVQGHAVGGGAVLPAACDLRIGARSSSIRISELDLGMPFSMGGFPRLARLIGLSRAADLTLTGRKMMAQEALDAGYFSRLVDDDELSTEVEGVLAILSQRSPLSLLETTRRIRSAAAHLLDGGEDDLLPMMACHNDADSQAVGTSYRARFVN